MKNLKTTISAILGACTLASATAFGSAGISTDADGVGRPPGYHAYSVAYYSAYIAAHPIINPSAVKPAATPAAIYGTTIPQIQANFPAIIANEFAQNPTIDAQFSAWPDIVVARFSTNLWRDSHGNVAPFLAVAAQRLSAANLLRLQAALGAAVVTPAVQAHSSAATKAAYLAAPARAALKHSHMALANGYMPQVNPLMDITDIFYEFFAVEGATVTTAWVATIAYAAAYCAPGWTVGFYGTQAVFVALNQVAGTPEGTVEFNIVASLLASFGVTITPVYNPNPTVDAPVAPVIFPLPDAPTTVTTPLPDGGWTDIFSCFGDDACGFN